MSKRSTRSERTDQSGRITGIEVASYSAALAFIAALALGYFNAMVPWR